MSSESTRPLLKFPIDLRTHVLYEKYQHISTEKSYLNYEKLCEAMGNEAISIEEYENWLKEYLKEDERDLPIPDIRGCILSNVINGKTAEKSIDNLCDAFNNHIIDEEDHDYWYKRFDSGHLFNRITFSDFPEDVIAEIVGKCDIKSYFNLHNVSHGLRTVIDQLTPPCTDIEVDCREDRITVLLNSEHIAEYLMPLGLIRKRSFKMLELLVRNPKLRLKSFDFATYPHIGIDTSTRNYKEDFFDLLNSLNRKIHVENCSVEVDSEKDLIGILQYFKPETLETLYIEMRCMNSRIDEVVTMNQWKMAKHLKIITSMLPSIDNFFHFSTFELQRSAITMEDVVKLCENASKSNSFEYCKVDIQKEFKLETIKIVLNLQPTSSPRIYFVKNTNLIVQYLGKDMFSYVFKMYTN